MSSIWAENGAERAPECRPQSQLETAGRVFTSRPCGELRLLGRPAHGGGLRLAAGDRHRDLLEVARADLVLVLDRGVALLLVGELGLLELGVGRHAVLAVAAGELEHRVVERVEAGEGDELEGVAELAEARLEGG